MKPVTDPAILSQLESGMKPVSDPAILDQLEGNAPNSGVIKNLGIGALRGASNIGATALYPIDKLTDVIAGSGPISRNQQRRAKLSEFFGNNADPNSVAFKAGELGAEIAGTAGIGGALAKGVMPASKIIPALAQYAPKISAALSSGGMALNSPAATTLSGMAGNAALRTGAGAIVSGASAGLVDPESAVTGAMIGGALPGAVKIAGMAGVGLRSAGEHILGMMTGTGTEAIKNALASGKSGATEFLEHMRGNAAFDDVVNQAKAGLQNMRKERAAAYRSGMVDIKNDKTILDMTPINDAVNSVKQSGNFKGKVINQKAGGVIDEIDNLVSDWAKSKPSDFHTPEGLDALKQAIGDIRDSTQFGTPARRAADTVYNAVKNEIKNQSPTYEKVMRDYAQASDTLQEIEKTLSAGEKSSKDTAIRKLQSLMRNNAQTNYGNRLALANTLENKGGVSLGPSIAGQAMSSWLPRGMVGSIEKAGMPLTAFLAPQALAIAPFTSPRLMGESLYGLGRLSGASERALASMVGPQVARQPMNALMANPVARNALIQLSVANP